MIRFRTSCRWLAVGAVCAVLAVGTGCRHRAMPSGGATNPKAQAARTQAESYTVEAVIGAAEVQARIDASPHEGGARGPIAQQPNRNGPISIRLPPATFNSRTTSPGTIRRSSTTGWSIAQPRRRAAASRWR